MTPQTGNRVGDFTVVEPKVADRIGGKFDHGTPAIVFNQDDQKALRAGGSAAVGAMAAAWAVALSETVVGSVLSLQEQLPSSAVLPLTTCRRMGSAQTTEI